MAALVALGMVCAGCAGAPESAPPAGTTAPDLTVEPARIDRARHALPPGYEVAPYTGAPTPLAVWGLAGPVEAQPAQCVELAAPPVRPDSAQGWSASGPGGIIYAIVAAAAPGPPVTDAPGPPVTDAPGPPVEAVACQSWTATAGHTSATVRELPAPALEAAHTVGMATAATTVVEGGTETRADADTFVAHLGHFVCFVALVTDPGSAYPRLDAAFAADLLVETVSALRS
ncbi:DUF5642 family protein [Mycolicibacterium poriferae]|uniref:DUF5642 domain-containing protein n=1 Tax=Mycolicibacterium poriferae TaxID=39694 RepID=A0A6N4VE41_9MYCO|nr:hypothetical protein MPOR_49520 [Mycolicibacterium poriferae]